MKFCTQCGAKLEDDALFCTQCGAKQEIYTEPAEQPAPEPAIEQHVAEEPAAESEIQTVSKTEFKAPSETAAQTTEKPAAEPQEAPKTRFEKIFDTPENLFVDGSPVVVSKAVLFKDNHTGKGIVQVSLKQISDFHANEVNAKVVALDANGDLIGEFTHKYQNIPSDSDEAFGESEPILVDAEGVRSIAIKVTEVKFADGTDWIGNSAFEPVNNSELFTKYLYTRANFNLKSEDKQHIENAIEDFRKIGSFRDTETLLTEAEAKLKEIEEIEAQREAEAQEAVAEAKAKKAKKTKKTRTIIIAIIAVLVLAGAAFAAFKFVIPEVYYNKAYDLVVAGQYEEARNMYLDLGDYKNSSELAEDCVLLQKDEAFEAAEQLLEEKKYDEAIAAFKALGTFNNADQKIQEVEDTRTEDNYLAAIALLDQKKYDEAKTAFTALKDYKESQNYILECNYQKANELFGKGEYYEAGQLYGSVGQYIDAEDLGKESFYLAAKEYIEKDKKYVEANELLETLGSYKDSRTLQKEAMYQAGLEYLAVKDYDEANKYFEKIRGYKDADALYHNHSYSSEVIKEALCEEPGEIKYTCEVCGYEYTEAIPATGHHFSKEKVIKAATCTQDGTKELTCECGETTQQTIKATGHNYVHSVIQQVSCETPGREADTCTNCGDIKYTDIPATGHVWKDATCTEPKTCIVCGAKEGSALGHSMRNGVCSRCGFMDLDPYEFEFDSDGSLSPKSMTGKEMSTEKKTVTLYPGYWRVDYVMDPEYDDEDDSGAKWTVKIGSLDSFSGKEYADRSRQIYVSSKTDVQVTVKIRGYAYIMLSPEG